MDFLARASGGSRQPDRGCSSAQLAGFAVVNAAVFLRCQLAQHVAIPPRRAICDPV
jgi:hypothetical protein